MKRPHNYTFEEIKAYSKDLLELYPDSIREDLIELRPALEASIKAVEAAIDRARGEAVMLDLWRISYTQGTTTVRPTHLNFSRAVKKPRLLNRSQHKSALR